jgi:hypothetical protein
MQVIMGGSGSTGSSLLKNILNRNQDIFSGEETSFFAKKMIYENWSKARNRVLKRKFFGLRNFGWHIYNGTDLLHPEYLWEKEQLEQLLKNADALQEFTSAFYAKPLQLKGAAIWLEKTPANAACFSHFLRSFEEGKVIHIVRNPFDTIASLQSRGFDLYYAVGIYLLNTACGLSVKNSRRSYTVKYEDLIGAPELTVRGICSFLDISYNAHMLEPQGEIVINSKLSGWKYDETKNIGKGSVGRFNQLAEKAQDAIMEAVNRIHINERGQGYYNTKIQNVKDICEVLDYDFYSLGKTSTLKSLKGQQQKDRMIRILRGYPSGFYYPLEIY